jgi:CII-binding regulator of phage lambda lysogenization HflD
MKRSRTSDSKISQRMAQQLLEKYEKELNELESWIKTKPNLPQNLGERITKVERGLGWRNFLSH